MGSTNEQSLGLFIQPACLQHKYIRHANSSHIFERPERLRAVLLGFAAAVARLEATDKPTTTPLNPDEDKTSSPIKSSPDDLSALLNSLSIHATSTFMPPILVNVVQPPIPPTTPGQVLLHHPALQLAHSPPIEAPFPYLANGRGGGGIPSSSYMRDLFKWATEAVEMIKMTGCEIPKDLGLNQGDLYLGPGSVLAIEGAIQTVCQAVDKVCAQADSGLTKQDPSSVASTITPLERQITPPKVSTVPANLPTFSKAFCAIRPPGHHCGEDSPSGFCYVNNVVVGAMHAYLQQDIDRAIIIDFDLHHGNGTQALVMPLNAATHSEDLAVAGGKPPSTALGKHGDLRRGWKGFYGSVHDIYSYPCEDGDLDLISDASISVAAHGQYIENIHLQPYTSEADFYERIYPKYLALLDKAKVFMKETGAKPEKTLIFISAGFDACEHEHQGMQRHDRRVPVSFFSRYTRDIAAFADVHTAGKVVSVLEGGYSDRALTSAAMGHAIGLLGHEGVGSWWTDSELDNIERATKKKRTGKLASLSPDLAGVPYLARTHALLAYFEGGVPQETSAPASAAATPQGRMTLRDRKKHLGDDGGESTGTGGTPALARRGRGKTTPGVTPRKTKQGGDGSHGPGSDISLQVTDVPKIEDIGPATSTSTPLSLFGTRVPMTVSDTDSFLADALLSMQNISLNPLATHTRPPPTMPPPASLPPDTQGEPSDSRDSRGTLPPAKIMLRIPRQTPPPSTTPTMDMPEAVSQPMTTSSSKSASVPWPLPAPEPAPSPAPSIPLISTRVTLPHYAASDPPPPPLLRPVLSDPPPHTPAHAPAEAIYPALPGFSASGHVSQLLQPQLETVVHGDAIGDVSLSGPPESTFPGSLGTSVTPLDEH